MVKQFGFGKQEKLKSRKLISDLFTSGKSFSVPPIRVTYQFLPSGEQSLLQVGVSVGKKYFKRAVDRNRIKRLIRESYRLQKKQLLEDMNQSNATGYVFFIYTGKTIVTFDEMKESIGKCLSRLQKKIKD